MNLILADSNQLILIGLRTVFAEELDVEIIGEAHSDEELLAQLNAFGEAIVLIDYTSENFSIDVIPRALQLFPKAKFVAITPDQSAQTVVDALRSGVLSYIKKDCDFLEITNAVKETAKGHKFFCGQVLESIKKACINTEDIDFESFSCEAISLSERELEIIKLIAEGNTNAHIAELIFLSTHTVNTHRKNIMAKLGVKNTAGIVMYAVKTNLVSPNKFLFAKEA
jgi:DNA-binding NarL/FixJ family response regulator